MRTPPVITHFNPLASRLGRASLFLCCFFATLSRPAETLLAAPTTQSPAAIAAPASRFPSTFTAPIDTATPIIAPANVQLLTSGTPTNLRGLSVVSDKVIWVSGSNGAVGRSVDGGATWTWTTVPGYEKRDFRDIEAFDEKTAIVMAIATPAQLLKTGDGGKTWRIVYNNETPGMFLDAMEFWDLEEGIVIGDPINGHFFIARSFDGGSTWHDIPYQALPVADSGEGCFAASGTNVRLLDKKHACFVSGGPSSRLFLGDEAANLPILQGKASTGANSVAVKEHKKGEFLIVVGGDFSNDTLSEKNCFLTHDRGKTWIRPTTPPHGYRSCVEFFGAHHVLSCGLTGVDMSSDDGMDWQLLTTHSFNTCRKAKKGETVFLAGAKGSIAKLLTTP